uniref:AB hydrolase-1 domain-containing protein n=1 Tax=Phytophthora ramorum TaxID=164328 RepID=H3GEH8_PHYRM
MYTAPLCYPGICETPDSVNSTVDVFVKRLPALQGDPETTPSVWLLQGGPGFTPALLDLPMVNLYVELNASVNVYTMDYRGTGRGTMLTCKTAKNSSSATEIAQFPECAQELQETYGDLAAFSTTSAAMDLVTFISDHGNDFSTTVYGVGYGTVWVERVIHLDPPEVTGYVLDGVTTASGASPDKIFNASSADTDFGEVSDALLALCVEDSVCSSRFKKKGIQASIQHLFSKLDKNPKSTCSELIKTTKSDMDEDPPSFALRYVLGTLVIGTGTRTLIPPVVYRLLRCAPKDVDVLSFLISMVNDGLDTEQDALMSGVLDAFITFSEMWESPASPVLTLKAEFEQTTASARATYAQIPQYCASSKEKSPTCDKLKVGNYEGNGIIYERDEYWNKAAKIPDQASVLLMGSKMDPMAPSKYGEYLLEVLDGDNKELITFDYTMQGSLVDSNSFDVMCGMTVLSSYVKGRGDLKKLNKACVDDMPALNWTIPIEIQYFFLGTDDAYDGAFDASLSDSVAAVDER